MKFETDDDNVCERPLMITIDRFVIVRAGGLVSLCVYFKMKFLLVIVVLATITQVAFSLIKGIRIDPSTSTWRDDRNRSRIWHGINFVEKSAPFFPTIEEATITKMNEMGLTAVRLGVQVGGTFPNNSTLNVEYLDRIEEIVDRLWNAGIATILDMHQVRTIVVLPLKRTTN